MSRRLRGAKIKSAYRPKRARRTDPGNPDDCPVWTLHQVYSNDDTKAWVRQGCDRGIGCLECKQPVIDAVNAELAPMQARIREIEGPARLCERGARSGLRAP